MLRDIHVINVEKIHWNRSCCMLQDKYQHVLKDELMPNHFSKSKAIRFIAIRIETLKTIKLYSGQIL